MNYSAKMKNSTQVKTSAEPTDLFKWWIFMVSCSRTGSRSLLWHACAAVFLVQTLCCPRKCQCLEFKRARVHATESPFPSLPSAIIIQWRRGTSKSHWDGPSWMVYGVCPLCRNAHHRSERPSSMKAWGFPIALVNSHSHDSHYASCQISC